MSACVCVRCVAARELLARHAQPLQAPKDSAVVRRCLGCDQEWEVPRRTSPGSYPGYCPDCQFDRLSSPSGHSFLTHDAAYEDEGVCKDCAEPWTYTYRGRGARPERCPSCHSERVRRQLAARNLARRARRFTEVVELFAPDEIYERDGWVCGICRRKIRQGEDVKAPFAATIDHVVPLSRGGEHTRANARAAHRTCNVRRGNRLKVEQLALV